MNPARNLRTSPLDLLRRRLERALEGAVTDAVAEQLRWSGDEYLRELAASIPGSGEVMPCCGRPVWSGEEFAFGWSELHRTLQCSLCDAVYSPKLEGS